MKVLIAGQPNHAKYYEAALRRCNCDYDTTLAPTDLSKYHGLLLPGGGDIHPSRFHQKNAGSFHVDPALDKVQFAILDAFVQVKKPILGICRGMQLINVYFGGDLIQDLPTASAHRYKNKDQYHLVKNRPGSLPFRLYGSSCIVNSAHHQGCGRMGHGLRITQIAPDNVIEGLEHIEKPIVGVQWHPERTGFSFQRPGIADGELLIRSFSEFLQSFPPRRGCPMHPHLQ